MASFKLTEEDKKYLSSIGYPTNDFTQIEEAANECTYTKICEIPKKKYKRNVKYAHVIKLVGRKQFLASIGRAAFHCSTSDYVSDKITIEYNLSIWW